MSIIKRLFLGWRNIFSKFGFVQKINFSDLMWIVPLILSLTFIGILIANLTKEKIRKRRYLINKHHVRFTRRLTNKMIKYSILKKLLNYISLKLCVFNDRSFETNREYSSIVIIALLMFTGLTLFILIPSANIIWYQLLFFLGLAMTFLAVIFYMTITVVKFNFTKQLPRTFKLLNSRFARKGDILEAIDISIEDFDKAIARELTRISEVLVKNDDDKINEEFTMIEKIYNNEYFTVLLTLIKHAYYKPGNEAVQKIFSNTTSSIMIELQVQKKLSLANIWYIIISFSVPYGIEMVEKFNSSTLGADTAGFYTSPLGVGLKILIYLSMFAYILGLLLLKRTA